MGDGGRSGTNERGFTLLEMLVVMLIIATLAAIAIPVFFSQRDKGLIAQSQSALANAKLAAESFYVGDGDGSYSELDDDADADGRENIYDEGLRIASGIELIVIPSESGDSYCIGAVHFSLPETNEWQLATVSSTSGSPSPEDDC